MKALDLSELTLLETYLNRMGKGLKPQTYYDLKSEIAKQKMNIMRGPGNSNLNLNTKSSWRPNE